MDRLRSNDYAIAFDVEGTLADTIPTHQAARLAGFAKQGFGDITPEQHALGPTYGSTKADIIGGILYAAGAIDNNPPFDEHPTVKAVLESYSRVFSTLAAQGFPEMPGASDFVRDIAPHSRQGLAVVTSSQERYIRPFLNRYDIAQFFRPDLLITEDILIAEGLKNKPAPDPYLLTMGRLGTQNLLVFEDTAPGVMAAKKAGAFVIALSFDKHNAELFASDSLEFPPDITVADFDEARVLLGI